MRADGLQTILKNNIQLSQRFELSDTSLYDDTSDLQCNIYRVLSENDSSKLSHHDEYGGDFVAYSEELRKFYNPQNCHHAGSPS